MWEDKVGISDTKKIFLLNALFNDLELNRPKYFVENFQKELFFLTYFLKISSFEIKTKS